VAFVDQIPRTSVGKYDKKRIRASYADNVFDVERFPDESADASLLRAGAT